MNKSGRGGVGEVTSRTTTTAATAVAPTSSSSSSSSSSFSAAATTNTTKLPPGLNMEEIELMHDDNDDTENAKGKGI